MSSQGTDERQEFVCYAIRAGDLDHVKDLLEIGVDINVKDDNGRTAFILAAENGCAKCLDMLIRKVDDINQKDDFGNTALHVAASQGNIKCVETLVEFGVNLNEKNLNNESAVCLAAVNGHNKCVKKILFDFFGLVQARFNFWDESDIKSLCEAAKAGHYECVLDLLYTAYENDEGEYYELYQIRRHLLSYERCMELSASKSEADRMYSEQNGFAALCCASIVSEHKCLTALIDKGLDVNNVKAVFEAQPPLCYAAEYGSLECVKALLEAGADVNMRDRNNHSALYWTLRQIHLCDDLIESVKAFIRAGMDVNMKDSHGKTDLFEAVTEGPKEVMEILIEAGADINVIDAEGKSVLHYASMGSDPECVTLLLEQGASVDVRDKHGHTPLALAVKRKSEDSVRSLIAAGANIYARDVDNEMIMEKNSREKYCDEININEERTQALITAAWKGQSEQIASLIENGADVNVKVDDGTTALIAASWEGHAQCVDVLLRVEKIDVNARDYYARTALFAASYGGHIECLETILAHRGVILDSQNKEKITPLMIAAKKQRVKCVAALMGAGVDVTAIDNSGFTVFMTAAKNGSSECLQTLVNTCGSSFDNDSLCKNALILAIAYAQVKCVEILFEHLPDAMKSLSEVQQLLTQTCQIRGRKHDEIISTLFKAGVFHWKWYPAYDHNMYRGGIRNLTRDLILNGYAPDQFHWRNMTCTPLQYAFRIAECGTVRYLLANLYLTPYDVSHFQRDTELADFVRKKGSVELQSLHRELLAQPWRLETLGILGVLNLLRRYGCKQEDSLRRSGITGLLPAIFVRRLTFCNPIRYLCTHDWNKIEGDFLNLNSPSKPAAENMVKKAKCSACSTECMTINPFPMSWVSEHPEAHSNKICV